MRTKIHQIGIIGLGVMGLRHVDTVKRSPRARLIAVSDIDEELTRRSASSYCCKGYIDYRTMLEEADIDSVIICTPDHLHVQPTLDSFAAQKHVLLEKPIATTLEDADRIIEAANRASTTFTVGHCLRFDAKYVAIKERIDAGELGHLVSVFTRRQNRMSSQDRLLGRVSSQLFLGVHDYDVINWYLRSSPLSVYCESTSHVMRQRGFEIDDISFTSIRYANGSIAMAETGWLLPESYPSYFRFELTAMGSAGTAHLEYFDEGVQVATNRWYQPSLGDRLTPQLHHFLDCIETGEQPKVTGKDARLAIAIALAAEESAKVHQPVRIRV